ncbi:hypothetical protein HZB88_03565 [archaeon]|nr:hypothetical protein [archaeon]
MKRIIAEGMLLLSLVCGIGYGFEKGAVAQEKREINGGFERKAEAQERGAIAGKPVQNYRLPEGWEEDKIAGKRHKVVVRYSGADYSAVLLKHKSGEKAWLILNKEQGMIFTSDYGNIAKTATIAYFTQDKNAIERMLLTWIREIRSNNKSMIMHDYLEDMLEKNPILSGDNIEFAAKAIGSGLGLDLIKNALIESVPGIIYDYLSKESKAKGCSKGRKQDIVACFTELVQTGEAPKRIEDRLYDFLEIGRYNLEQALIVLKDSDGIWDYEKVDKFQKYFIKGFLTSDYVLTFWKALQPQTTWEQVKNILIPSLSAHPDGEEFSISLWVKEALNTQGSAREALKEAEQAYEKDVALCYNAFERFYSEQGRVLLLNSLLQR